MSSTDQLLIVQFDKSDAELQQSLTDTFGDNAKPIDAYGFDGGVIDASCHTNCDCNASFLAEVLYGA